MPQEQTEEQRKRAYQDAGVPYNPITAASLASTQTVNFQQPNYTPVYPVATLNTPALTSTASEMAAGKTIDELKTLNERNTGQSVFRAEQETAFGVPDLNKNITDLSTQLKGLTNEALAIPLQLQNEYQGRGATVGGVAPIQTARLRENAIKSLSVSALLEAARGNLTTAMDRVDRAVAQKYNPIKEEIAAKTANLDLILKSPAYSLEEKNRAQAQKDTQDANTRAITRQEDAYKAAQAMAAAAIKANPNNPAAAMAVRQVLQLNPSDSQYLEKVFGLVGKYQSDPAQVQKDLDAHLLAVAQRDKIYADIKKANTELTSTETEQATAWVKNIQQGTAKLSDVPAKLKNAVSAGLANASGDKSSAGTLKENALKSANDLLSKFESGSGTSAVGASGLLNSFGYGYIPGTSRADFVIQFNNLKSLLSLENVKFLKGQGQVSDAERRLLAEASAKLDLAQSEGEFKSALIDIKNALSGDNSTLISPDGTQQVKRADLTPSELEEAKKAGWK